MNLSSTEEKTRGKSTRTFFICFRITAKNLSRIPLRRLAPYYAGRYSRSRRDPCAQRPRNFPSSVPHRKIDSLSHLFLHSDAPVFAVALFPKTCACKILLTFHSSHGSARKPSEKFDQLYISKRGSFVSVNWIAESVFFFENYPLNTEGCKRICSSKFKCASRVYRVWLLWHNTTYAGLTNKCIVYTEIYWPYWITVAKKSLNRW